MPEDLFHGLDPFQIEALERRLPILRYFHYGHLPVELQMASKPFCELAWWAAGRAAKWVEGEPQTTPEIGAGLRKLLEAKDCFVRARL